MRTRLKHVRALGVVYSTIWNHNSELKMFWGLKLESGNRYSQLVEQPFHISHAALASTFSEEECRSVFPEGVVEVHVEVKNTDYIVCLLDGSQRVLQQSLDLNVSEGEEVVLYAVCHTGDATLYLTGYYVEELGIDQRLEDLTNDEFLGDSEEEEEEEEDEDGEEKDLASWLQEELSSEDDADDDYVADAVSSVANSKGKEGEEEEEEEEEEEMEEEEESGSDNDEPMSKKDTPNRTEVVTRKRKLNQSKEPSSKKARKLQQKAQKKEAKELRKEVKGLQKDEKEEEKGNIAAKKKAAKPTKTRTKGGVEITDTVLGTGKVAKPGKLVLVRYTGMLADSKKVFDSNTSSDEAFAFRLGKGEVIKGWDEGVKGMQVGGKRKLTIPPKQGYGARGSPPNIPPNAKLVFDVELVAVK